jgi:class 3 adenylate cyclase
MNLTKKIFLTFFVSVAALLSITLYLIDTQAERHQIQRIITDLDKTQFQFQRDLETEQKHIQTLTYIITSDQKFRSFLSQIKDNFYPFTAEIGKDTGADFVFMLDDQPAIRAVYAADAAVNPPLAGNFSAFGIEKRLESGLMASTIIGLPEGLYSSHFIPLKENLNDEYAVGLIVVCNRIDDHRVGKLLAKGSGFQAVFFNHDKAVAKNTTAEFADAVLSRRQDILENGMFIWNNQRYIAKRILFDAENTQAGYILGANLDEALQTFKQLERQILFIGTSILFAGALLFILISRRITRPLRLITQGTLEIKGGRYEHRIDYRSKDEVGQLAAAFNAMAGGLQEKERILGTFNKYVDPAIVSELLSQPDKLKLGGERKKQTVLFSDIAEFTSFSEKIPAEALVRVLNEYLTAMTLEIGRQHGILDKFIGDAIMAFWSPQLSGDKHALHACHTALNMQQTLRELRPLWIKNGGPEIRVRIGIATGEMIVGNIGSEHARSYTCIGDRVNFSSRLEGLNKFYGTEIIIDRPTAADTSGLLIRELDSVRVKGKEGGETIYELIGKTGQADSEIVEKIDRYQRALALYRQAEFSKAADIFSVLPGDAASRLMLQRCQQLQQNPPEVWDGIHSMLNK